VVGKHMPMPDLRCSVPLTGIAIEALKRRGKRQAEEKMRTGSLYQDEDLVFASEIGTALDAQNVVNRSFKPLLERAGLPSVRFHDLRHVAARQGGPSEVRSSAVGSCQHLDHDVPLQSLGAGDGRSGRSRYGRRPPESGPGRDRRRNRRRVTARLAASQAARSELFRRT
jgi:hypothetical protein